MKRSKIIAISIVCLFLGSILSALATRTITDTSDIWTGTNVWQGNVDFESGVYFNLSKKIYNSNGLIYNVTAANIQTAINNLNNESGFVQLPECDITLSTYLKVGDGCWLRGVGNGTILRLADSANTSIIRNYDQTNGNVDIKISDIRIEGNGKGQAVYYDAWYSYRCGIYLKKCNKVEIYGITVNDTGNQGVLADKCKFINIHDCFFTNLGIEFDGSGLAHYAAEGIYYYNTSDSVITNCIVDNAFSVGFVVEGYLSCPWQYRSKNVTVSNCVVTDTGCGYYVEDAAYVTFDACRVTCGTDNSCFGANTAAGFKISSKCDYITVIGSTVRDTYRGIADASSGKYMIISGNTFNDTTNYGLSLTCVHSLISTNTVMYTGNNAISASGHNNTIIGNYIYHAGQWSAGIALAGSKNTSVIGNKIIGTGTNYPNLGVYGSSAYNAVVLYNSIYGVDNEIYQVNATRGCRINCTGYDDWNFYMGVS